ncbi:MAG: TRAP transporter large permease, partial [Desulfobacterales bacterium]|nr:TRAP transporter large permease [Desulfobacterales bacterium]
ERFIVFALSGSMVVIGALDLPWSMVAQQTFDSITKYLLLAIPLFIFAGMVLIESGMARRIVNVFIDLVGHFKGGIAIAMVLAMGFFGALCGSILAAIVAIGTIMIPIMEERGYSKPFVAALACCAGCLDALIPPSNGAIIFSAITGEPVSRTFAAGIIPALVYTILLIIIVIWRCWNMENHPRAKFSQFTADLWKAIPALLTPVIILGGIYTGILTPTESAAVAGVWAIFVGFCSRQLKFRALWNALKSTAATSSMIFAVIATASFLSIALTYTRAPHTLINYATSIGITPVLFLLAGGVVVVMLGTFMEVVPILYLTIPIFAPIAVALEIELVHLYVVNAAFVGIGLITPPVCMGAYTAAAVARESSERVIKALFPLFLIMNLTYAMIVLFFPAISSWLPDLIG